METKEQTQHRYWAALDKLTAKLEEDYYVLAVVLYGSLARGEPWEKSDIDLMIVVRDDPQNRAPDHVWISADGINVFAEVYPRNDFKRALEGTLQGSTLHSIRSQFKLLFTKDDSIAAWLDESAQIGERDLPFQLLRTAAGVLYPLEKAHKWLYAKHDINYSFLWLLMTVNALARVEVVLNGEAPGREALDQALVFNPEFFQAVYVDLINGPKTAQTIESVLEAVEGYLEARAQMLFAPVFDYLAEGDNPRTATEMSTYFHKKTQTSDLGFAYEWLADHGFIEKLASPLRLTRKSRVTVDEPAYYYDQGPEMWE
ncbi:MAG: nucleotidyltransferase domain-containing protein [Anaerolineae bacterium]|nr:nucleotidyltransferase domain-containing protein [Anaerolineae bacterium]